MVPSPGLSYLDRVVLEIVESERIYVRDLRMIIQGYLGYIIDQSELCIPPDQVCALFGNIEDIYEFNSALLQDLDQCGLDPVEVARCFILKSGYFEIYTQYCTNYPRSVQVLAKILRDETLASFLRQRQQTLNTPLPLGPYLLKPVQRILKYHLLLQEIRRHFGPSADGQEVVEEAIFSMTAVAWFINEMKRRHETSVRVQEVQSLLLNWKGPDLTTCGDLVLEGTFKMHRVKNQRNLFLFQKVLLITKKRGEHYMYKHHITCATLMLIENARDSLSFSITHYKHPKQLLTVQTRSLEEKQLWAHHVKRIILENHQNIIPQKAKEAILDRAQFCRFRYSPEERLKKNQTGECHVRSGSTGDETKPTPESEPGSEPDRDTDQSLDHVRAPPRCKESAASDEPKSSEPDPYQNQDQVDSDCRTLSSESETEEELDPIVRSEPVLDQTHAMFSSFTSSLRCSSRSRTPEPDYNQTRTTSTSPRSSRRTTSAETSPRLSTRTPEPPDSVLGSNPGPSSDLVLDEDVFESVQKRRDSCLSLRDQLLMEKIRAYYETQVRTETWIRARTRRESLDHIPAGLVQNSVYRFNSDTSLDQDQDPLKIKLSLDPGPNPEQTHPRTSSHRAPLDEKQVQNQVYSGSEEDSRSWSEMIRIWKEVDQQNQTRTRGRIRERASSYSCEADDEEEQTQHKVQVLAQRYSQCLKTTTPRTPRARITKITKPFRTTAPISETTAPISPISETTAPISETTAPISPISETTAPISETTAPISPISETTAPISPISPISGTTTPISPISAPISGTTAPISETTAPISETTAPISPISETTAPISPIIETTEPIGPVLDLVKNQPWFSENSSGQNGKTPLSLEQGGGAAEQRFDWPDVQQLRSKYSPNCRYASYGGFFVSSKMTEDNNPQRKVIVLVKSLPKLKPDLGQNQDQDQACVSDLAQKLKLNKKSTKEFQVKVNSETKSEMKSELQSEIKSEMNSGTISEMRSGTKSEMKSESKSEIKCKIKSKIKPKSDNLQSQENSKMDSKLKTEVEVSENSLMFDLRKKFDTNHEIAFNKHLDFDQKELRLGVADRSEEKVSEITEDYKAISETEEKQNVDKENSNFMSNPKLDAAETEKMAEQCENISESKYTLTFVKAKEKFNFQNKTETEQNQEKTLELNKNITIRKVKETKTGLKLGYDNTFMTKQTENEELNAEENLQIQKFPEYNPQTVDNIKTISVQNLKKNLNARDNGKLETKNLTDVNKSEKCDTPETCENLESETRQKINDKKNILEVSNNGIKTKHVPQFKITFLEAKEKCDLKSNSNENLLGSEKNKNEMVNETQKTPSLRPGLQKTKSVSDSELDHSETRTELVAKQKSNFEKAKENFDKKKSVSSEVVLTDATVINKMVKTDLTIKPEPNTKETHDTKVTKNKIKKHQLSIKTKDASGVSIGNIVTATATENRKQTMIMKKTVLSENKTQKCTVKESNGKSRSGSKVNAAETRSKPDSISIDAVSNSSLHSNPCLVQIRSPTSREKICVWAITERLRIFQTEPKQQTENRKHKDKSSKPQRSENNSETDGSETRNGADGSEARNVVKNLRQKFQSP